MSVRIERVSNNIKGCYYVVKSLDSGFINTFPFKIDADENSVWHENVAKKEAIEYATLLRAGEIEVRENVKF